jgi:hypothetical protein
VIPRGQAIFVLRFQGVGFIMQTPGLGELIFNARTPACDHLQDRFVEKTLENPDQDQKVDDLKQECGPVQFQGMIPLWESIIIGLPFDPT